MVEFLSTLSVKLSYFILSRLTHDVLKLISSVLHGVIKLRKKVRKTGRKTQWWRDRGLNENNTERIADVQRVIPENLDLLTGGG